jgi:hypothetical protein
MWMTGAAKSQLLSHLYVNQPAIANDEQRLLSEGREKTWPFRAEMNRASCF